MICLILAALVSSSYALQACSVATNPSINALCPPGSGTYVKDLDACCPGTIYTVTTAPATTAKTCVDKLNPSTGQSDCPGMASYCTNSLYLAVMKDQCPKTCGFCSGSSVTTTPCVDQINAKTGTSDCPTMKSYCTNSVYLTLMKTQCPLSCGYCSG